MRLKRNTKLLNRCFLLTLVSTVLTALAPLVATLVDGLFSSNMLGVDAFNAVNVVMPIVNAVSVLTLICDMGGSVLAATQLANGNVEKANRIFTVSIISAFVVAAVTVLCILTFLNPLSDSLAPNAAQASYIKDYLKVLLLYFLLVPFCTCLNNFVSVEGHPGLTTKAVILANLVNVLLDVVFIGFFHWGIKGAAAATVVSGVVNLATYIPFFLKGSSKYRIVKVKDDRWSILGANLKHGFGYNVFYIVTNVFMLLCNSLISSRMGSDYLTLFGVCLQIQSLTFSMTVGLCIAGIALISFLRGAGDNKGVLFILDNAMKWVIGFYGVLLLLMALFPSVFLLAFGLKGDSWLEMARVPFLCYGIYYFCFCFIAVYVTLAFQLSGHVGAKVLFVFSISFFSYILMNVFAVSGPEKMWNGLVAGSIPVLLLALAYGYRYHRRNPQLSWFTVSDTFPDSVMIESSLDYDKKDFTDVKEAVSLFADTCEVSDELHQSMISALKKLGQLAVRNKKTGVRSYDFCLKEKEDCFQLTMRDSGSPFNPASLADPELSGRIDYRYIFGMNVSTIKWPKNS